MLDVRYVFCRPLLPLFRLPSNLLISLLCRSFCLDVVLTVYFVSLCQETNLESSCHGQCRRGCCLCSRILVVSCLTFRSLIHLGVCVCVCVIKVVQFHSFAYWPVFPVPFLCQRDLFLIGYSFIIC